MTPEFWLTTLVVVATPGTGVLYTVAAGLSRGTRASVLAAFACTLGIVPHVVAALTGLAALLHASALAFDVIKYLGVAYLVYLAWQTWRDRTDLRVEAGAPLPFWRVIRTGILINLLNPKLTIFFFAFLPQFVRPGDLDAVPRMLALSAAFMAVTFAVFVLYGAFAAAFRRHVAERAAVVTWLRRGFAATYLALAARLAVERR
jgi:threonine/homoserine/homoserine lactone efflux protein